MNISNEEKIAMAEQALLFAERNLYTELLLVGEDPDTFDLDSISNKTDENILKYDNIYKILDKINFIKNKIASL